MLLPTIQVEQRETCLSMGVRRMGRHWSEKHFHFLATSLVFLCLGSSAHAQLPTATISGVVKDATGAVVPGVLVVATNAGTGLTRSVTSVEDGSYRFSALPVGTYNVRA